ncbi:hypothetical protein E4U49_004160 [Claviceps purpurea]|nr:hypothetical protein E4U49_004160 [Claviceps purpurea]
MRIPQTQVPKPHQPQRPPRDEDAGKRATCIIDTRTSENPQTRIEGKLDNLTKGVADLPFKVSDEFMKRCVEFEKQLVTKSLDAEGLRSELQSLKKQLQQQDAKSQKKVKQLKTKSTEAKGLRSELQSLKKQLQQQKTDSQKKVEQLETKSLEAKGLRSELQSLKEQLEQQKSDSQEKVAVLTKTIQRLEEDKRKLRGVIPGNALRHKVSDDEIRQRFVNIRKKIEDVVWHPAYDINLNLMPPDSAKDSDIDVCQIRRDRFFFLRAAIYEIIHRCIFSRDAFGLAGCVSPLDCNQVAQFDQSLCDFEGLLWTRKGTKEVIFDSRLATFKCIENSSAAPRDNSGARGEIERLLFPLLNIGQDLLERAENSWWYPAEKNLLNPGAEINKLCDDAFALWLLTKKSSDRYQFDDLKRGVKYVSAKGAVGVHGVLGEYGFYKRSTRIAFVICGALTKTTGNGESEVNCVLEPAQVMVHPARQAK